MFAELPPDERIIVPLDTTTVAEAEDLIAELGPLAAGFKVGYELGYSLGWLRAAELVTGRGYKLFLDPKLNDIPRTMAAGVRALAELHPWIINIHASAGSRGIEAAVKNKGNAMIVAVTVLTSLTDEECVEVFGTRAVARVLSLARSAKAGSVDGIICSPTDLRSLSSVGELRSLTTITPGIRPSWANPPDDQVRVMTPSGAISAGADYLVIGRPILHPPQPLTRVDAIRRIVAEIDEVR